MTTQNLTRIFLTNFHQKMEIWNIKFLDERGKNTQALIALDLTSNTRLEILRALIVEDYIGGPIEDQQDIGSPLWVFGKQIKGVDIYIKIAMGKPNDRVICISFHQAEGKLVYPHKLQ